MLWNVVVFRYKYLPAIQIEISMNHTLSYFLDFGYDFCPTFCIAFIPSLQLHKRFLVEVLVFDPIGLIGAFLFLGMFGLHCKWNIGGLMPDYLLGSISIATYPLKNGCFLFVCPLLACLHMMRSLCFPKPSLDYSNKLLYRITLFSTALASLLFAVVNYDKWYTVINFSLAIPLTYLVYTYNIKLLQHFLLTFLVMLIPFFIVNGILTGSFIEDQVVWYNNAENLGIRMGTIPVEDSIYAYTMILCNLFLTEFL